MNVTYLIDYSRVYLCAWKIHNIPFNKIPSIKVGAEHFIVFDALGLG